MPYTTYVVSEQLAKISSKLPSNRNRSILVHSLVQSFGLLCQSDNNVKVLTPTPATFEQLCTFHDSDYVRYITMQSSRSDEESESYGLVDDCPIFDELPTYTRLIAGASLTAARALTSNDCQFAIAWDGGRHHAQKSRASGFCYVNDCVLSILQFRKSKPGCRILYLDLDLHYSDGVSSAFSNSSNILTLSIHHRSQGFYPPSPPLTDESLFDISIPLAAGTSDRSFKMIWGPIEKVKDAFNPYFVVVQCGVDGLAGDPCKVWNWSLDGGQGSLAWCIRRVVKNWHVKTLFLGGGGYNTPNAARAWTYLTAIITGKPIHTTSTIPEDFPYFPVFGPSFCIDVPKGHVKDENHDVDIANATHVLGRVARSLETQHG